MPGEVECLDPDGVPVAEETLVLGREWPAQVGLARLTHRLLPPPQHRRIALVPLTLTALLAFGPLDSGPQHAGSGAPTHHPMTWTCTRTEPAAADAEPAARNLRGSLLVEQVQHRPDGRTCVSLTRPRVP